MIFINGNLRSAVLHGLFFSGFFSGCRGGSRRKKEKENSRGDIRGSRSINHRFAADADTMPPLSWKETKLGWWSAALYKYISQRSCEATETLWCTARTVESSFLHGEDEF